MLYPDKFSYQFFLETKEVVNEQRQLYKDLSKLRNNKLVEYKMIDDQSKLYQLTSEGIELQK